MNPNLSISSMKFCSVAFAVSSNPDSIKPSMIQKLSQ